MIARLALVLAVAGCFHDSSPSLSNGAPTNDANDQLAYVPIDSELVFGIDVAQLRGTALWKRFEPRIVHSIGKDYDDVRAACGFDPLETGTYFTIGLRFNDEDHVSGVVVARGLPSKVLDCVATRFGKGGDVTRDRGVVVLRENRMNIAWTMIGDALIGHIDPVAGHDSLERVVTSGAPLRQSPVFMSLYDRLDHHAALWGAANGGSRALEFLKEERPKSVSGTMSVSDRIDWTTTVRMPSIAEAAKVKDLLQHDLDRAQGFVNELDMKAAGDTLTVHVVVDGDKLDALFALAGIR
jgi:hypothetical protein